MCSVFSPIFVNFLTRFLIGSMFVFGSECHQCLYFVPLPLPPPTLPPCFRSHTLVSFSHCYFPRKPCPSLSFLVSPLPTDFMSWIQCFLLYSSISHSNGITMTTGAMMPAVMATAVMDDSSDTTVMMTTVITIAVIMTAVMTTAKMR
jgi:hypothetical protein